MKDFTIIFNKEDKFYVATCVELGVVSQGKTIEEARDNIKEAIELYLEETPKQDYYFDEAPFVSTVKVRA